MQVQVHEIHAKISGTNFPNQSIHVGAVHVQQAALSVHDVGYLMDLLFEYSQRVGIG